MGDCVTCIKFVNWMNFFVLAAAEAFLCVPATTFSKFFMTMSLGISLVRSLSLSLSYSVTLTLSL